MNLSFRATRRPLRAFMAFGVVSLLVFPLAAAAVEGVVTSDEVREGERLLKLRCGTCHAFTLPLGEEKDPSSWVHTVNGMSSRGLTLAAEEKDKILAFLASKSTFEEKCTQCHEKSRCLSRSKSETDWRRTVKRMSQLVPGGIGSDAVAAIASYLSVVCPRKGD